MSHTDRPAWMGPRLARLGRVLSMAGHLVVLVVCLGVLGSWVARAAQHVGRRVFQPAVPAFGAADVVYFYKPGCPACRISRPIIDDLQRRYPRYRWAHVDVSYPRGIELAEQYYLTYHVPEQDRGSIPAIFAGRRAFIGYGAIRQQFPDYLERAPLTRPPARKARAEAAASAAAASASIKARFASFRTAPVLVAGLVDSLNPCAIATLIFFLSYLAFTGRKPHAVLGVGAAFTAGVFVTYLLIGLGLLHLLQTLPITTMLGRWIYPLTGLATLVLTSLSLADFLKARRGQTAAITLQMPRALKRWTHGVIRTRMGPRKEMGAWRLAGAAFATAVVVSALEFTCTSQVYLPTLVYMTQVEGQRLRASGLLALYNLMFVTPLIVLFLLSYFGMSSRALGTFFARKTAMVKLAMTLLFASFSVYMFAVSARML